MGSRFDQQRSGIRHLRPVVPPAHRAFLRQTLAVADVPETRFALLGEDRIAYQVFGDGPPDLLWMATTADCIDARWEYPSYASFLRHRLGHPPGEPFVVISSGTWTVILAADGSERLDETRDCLVNVDALGEPIPTARFMGGREYVAIAGDDAPTPTFEDLEAVLTAGAVAWPCFAAAGGPFQGRIGRIEGTDGINGVNRTALASLYCALVADFSLDLLGSRGPIIVEGPFADNPLFGSLLAAFRPGQPVSLSQDRAGTIGGALALAAPDHASLPRLTPCRPFVSPRLGPYRRAWRARLELPRRTAASGESPQHQ